MFDALAESIPDKLLGPINNFDGTVSH